MAAGILSPLKIANRQSMNPEVLVKLEPQSRKHEPGPKKANQLRGRSNQRVWGGGGICAVFMTQHENQPLGGLGTRAGLVDARDDAKAGKDHLTTKLAWGNMLAQHQVSKGLPKGLPKGHPRCGSEDPNGARVTVWFPFSRSERKRLPLPPPCERQG